MDDYVKADIERQNALASRGLAESNSGCNPNSKYHDLKCGHRIRTEYVEDCGPNCQNGPAGTSVTQHFSFICRACVTGDIQANIMLNGLTLHDSSASRDEEMRFDSEEIIQAHIHDGARNCTAVNKEADGCIQFFKDFAAEVEAGGTDNAGANGKDMDLEGKRKFKRPSAAAPKSTGRNTMRIEGGRWKTRDQWSPYQVPRSYDPLQTHPKSQRLKGKPNPTTCDDPALETLFQQSGRGGNPPTPVQRNHYSKCTSSTIYKEQLEDVSGHKGSVGVDKVVEDKAIEVVRELLGGLYSGDVQDTRSGQL